MKQQEERRFQDVGELKALTSQFKKSQRDYYKGTWTSFKGTTVMELGAITCESVNWMVKSRLGVYSVYAGYDTRNIVNI